MFNLSAWTETQEGQDRNIGKLSLPRDFLSLFDRENSGEMWMALQSPEYEFLTGEIRIRTTLRGKLDNQHVIEVKGLLICLVLQSHRST
jgi:hypothetical protein